MIVAYVSGHGFGHSTRTAEVLREVRVRDPRVPIAIVCSGKTEPLYRRAIPGDFAFRPQACDVGLAQRSALVIDEAGTVAAWRRFQDGYAARLAREIRGLKERGARVVLGDIPPLAFEAAAEAGVPSIALANFSWDWIYRHLAARQTALHEAADQAAAAYARCGLLLELPFAGDLSAFPRRERIPLVARRPRMEKADLRRRLELEGTVALWSFGGLGLPGFDPAVLAGTPEVTFIVSDEAGSPPPNVRVIGGEATKDAGLEYVDLVAAADLVITKPGYGIVSDAIAARTRMLYTDRGDFPEYPIMVRQMGEWLPAEYASNAELLSGRLGDAIDRLMKRPMPAPPRVDGAGGAAERILAAGP
jgi:L-arabinokinase